MAIGNIEPVRSKTEPIPSEYLNPNYDNSRFTRCMGGRTIFLAEGLVLFENNLGEEYVEGVGYTYSDRFSSEIAAHYSFSDHRIARAQREARETVGNDDTAAYYEAMLRVAYGDSAIELKHMLAGVDSSHGSSFHVYGMLPGPDF